VWSFIYYFHGIYRVRISSMLINVLAIDFRRGRVQRSVRSIALQPVSGVLYIPFIHSRHNAKDRSLGVGRDIRVLIKVQR